MVQIAKKYLMIPVVLITKKMTAPLYFRSESHAEKSEDGFLTL